ncbi:folate-binding protein [Wolbachia endosymbiont of Cruorifilaria tuberocauda]|uniref:CAF17-like 4Fe-4S cluster assembly/insertion protein YgfZ n=1 Tax=Wolbachia endosymbiont of Cruorifilaria tuberocauda TaxID=1812111 RepID=UPI00158910D7|nr:folate-binding protein YgfZ [Wolbachia endosymbiont of Cruorifilaria tuberocauda]QKX01686.1 folate-binding protein [Wolbachia endosymbiont of Cruorifilaria tuberocauda]
MSYIPLQSRGVVALYGPDTRDFLQGIITNDIDDLSSKKAIYSLLLSPQGKYLYDFFLIEHGEYTFLECESIYLQQIIEKLDLLKTYLRVKIRDVSALYKIGVLFNTKLAKPSNESQVIFHDPRHKSLGMRIIHKKNEIKQAIGDFIQYEKIRIQNLIPDGAKDMVQNSSFPLQYLVDKINGISFNKGCYIGQEVVNRMSRQKTLRRKLYYVEGDNILPNIGAKIVNENNEKVGELRSSVDKTGLALLNTERSHANLCADGIKITVY